MKHTRLLVTALVACSCAGLDAPTVEPAHTASAIADLAIRHVTLIDGTGSAPLHDRTVLVSDGRIVAITTTPPAGRAQHEIDGRGRFLVPGLIDAHAHPSPAGPLEPGTDRDRAVFEPMLRFGVTTAVLYGGSQGSYASMARIAQRCASGAVNGPRIKSTSPIVTIEGAHPVRTYTAGNWVEGETILIPRSLSDIDEIVAEAARRQVLGVKITVEDGPEPPFIEPMAAEWVQRFVDEGERLGVPIYAHVSDMAEVRTCVDAGVHALVHFWGVMVDWDRDADVIERMLERDVSWVTTLVLGKGMVYYPQHPEWLDREELRSVFSPSMLDALRTHGSAQAARGLLETWTGNPDLTQAEFFGPDVAAIAEAQRRGVNIVLGTDVGNDFIFPGLALHEEMEILQAGGIAPLEILGMATHNAAKMLGCLDDLGTLEVGKLADMLLLTADPSVDIGNARAIERVLIEGAQRFPPTLETTLSPQTSGK